MQGTFNSEMFKKTLLSYLMLFTRWMLKLKKAFATES